MKPKDVVVNKLPFLSDEEDEAPQELEMESFFDDENDFTDPLLKSRFFHNTSNNSDQKKMTSFDEDAHDDKIYDLMLEIIEKPIDLDKENLDLKQEINTLFGKVIKNFRKFSSQVKCTNLLGRVFLQFAECIDVDSNVVFTNLLPSYQNMIKKELIKMIGEDTYRIYEKRCIDESKQVTINNHQDVIIHKI